MNPEITEYFDRLEQGLLEHQAVSGYSLVRREITPTEGKIRIRAQLIGGGLLELFEHVTSSAGGQVTRLRYAYHWQDAQGRLIRRWDCAPHHPQLPYAPHHVHVSDEDVEGIAQPPALIDVLIQIEEKLLA